MSSLSDGIDQPERPARHDAAATAALPVPAAPADGPRRETSVDIEAMVRETIVSWAANPRPPLEGGTGG